MADVQVVLQALFDAAHGVDAAMAELAAHDVTDLATTPAVFGHRTLGAVAVDFCDRWSHGVANLTDDGNALARGLVDAARAYAEAEDVAVDGFRWAR
ncbi:hypothetical protein [Actinomycetospora cinnamomea]|uniref:Excreted virulence factor EspC (Type VII ESX diderm) n=1 Tax=Actinomycetospora cinnamomea TaxID=663609 RepID=A0A2U1FFN3_9PSEU|nr:hypothetical protein [Actinomycetospora cinnamomea]PVZ11004.1 hypothetical protein C8D89_104218 [Actinomycetospora cinnamomea]